MVKTKHFALYRPREDLQAPIIYRPYYLQAGNWLTPGSGIAVVMTLADAPIPDDPFVFVESGGAEAALQAAEEAVKKMAVNEGLKELGR